MVTTRGLSVKRSVCAVTVGAVLAVSFGLTGCASGFSGVTPGPATSGVDEPAYSATLHVNIPQVMKDNAIPGAVVLIDSPDQGRWTATFGTAEIGENVPPTLDDYFRIGSNTKTMTSTVILQLVEQGKLSLDDPISKFRPDVPNGENITIAQLSEMRSGLFSYTFDPAFNATLDSDPQNAWEPDELLAIAFTHPANAAPGTVYEYSNTNIVLLGLVIEEITGMSASEAFDTMIFEPLGLTRTSLPVNSEFELPSPHAQGYQFGTNADTIDSYAVPADQLPAALDGSLLPLNYTDSNPSWAWTAGGAVSTPADLATYVKAMVGGGLLDEATQKVRMESIQPIAPGSTGGVGYGLGIAQFAPGILGHDGQLPGFSSFMAYNIDTGDTIIVALNLSASPVDGQNAAVVVGKSIIGTLYGAAELPSSSGPNPTAG